MFKFWSKISEYQQPCNLREPFCSCRSAICLRIINSDSREKGTWRRKGSWNPFWNSSAGFRHVSAVRTTLLRKMANGKPLNGAIRNQNSWLDTPCTKQLPRTFYSPRIKNLETHQRLFVSFFMRISQFRLFSKHHEIDFFLFNSFCHIHDSFT